MCSEKKTSIDLEWFHSTSICIWSYYYLPYQFIQWIWLGILNHDVTERLFFFQFHTVVVIL